MARFRVHHRHEPHECGIAFAASEQDALRLLPFFVAQRSTVARVGEVPIP